MVKMDLFFHSQPSGGNILALASHSGQGIVLLSELLWILTPCNKFIRKARVRKTLTPSTTVLVWWGRNRQSFLPARGCCWLLLASQHCWPGWTRSPRRPRHVHGWSGLWGFQMQFYISQLPNWCFPLLSHRPTLASVGKVFLNIWISFCNYVD